MPLLVKMLERKNDQLRQQVITALDRLGPVAQSAVNALAAIVADDNDDMRALAVTALGNIHRHARTAVPALVAAARCGDPMTSQAALTALGQYGADARNAAPALRELLNRPDAGGQLQLGVLTVLRKIDPGGGLGTVPLLEGLVNDPSQTVRLSAAALLWQVDPKNRMARDVLMDTIKGADAAARRDAITQVGEVGLAARDAIPVLSAALHDRTHSVHVAAALALWQIDPGTLSRALPVLTDALRNTMNQGYQQEAAQALGTMGPAAKPALRALWKASRDRGLRATVEAALKKIDPQAAAEWGIR